MFPSTTDKRTITPGNDSREDFVRLTPEEVEAKEGRIIKWVGISAVLFWALAFGCHALEAQQFDCFPANKMARSGFMPIRAAATLYVAENNTCPSIDQLRPDLQGGSAEDPWGSDYIVQCSGDRIDVWSLGADGVSGTHDDVLDWGQPESRSRLHIKRHAQ